MQAETGVYSTFLSVFCFCYPVWNMIYPIHHILLFSIFSQLRMTSHQIHSTCSESPISNSNMPLLANSTPPSVIALVTSEIRTELLKRVYNLRIAHPIVGAISSHN